MFSKKERNSHDGSSVINDKFSSIFTWSKKIPDVDYNDCYAQSARIISVIVWNALLKSVMKGFSIHPQQQMIFSDKEKYLRNVNKILRETARRAGVVGKGGRKGWSRAHPLGR